MGELMRVDSAGSRLRRELKDGACMWFLGEMPVTSGVLLEVMLPRNRWAQGFFEWSGQANDRPRFRMLLGGDWETVPTRDIGAWAATVLLPPTAILRPVGPPLNQGASARAAR